MYIAAESRVVRDVQRALSERGLDREQVSAKAYWRRGLPNTERGEPTGPDFTGERRLVHRSWRHVGAGVAALAAVAIGILSINVVQSNHQVNQLQAALSSKGDGAGVATALADPTHQTARMRTASGAEVAQFVVVPGGRGYMTGSSMPPLPKDETYQLWAVLDGQPISVGLLGNQVTTAAFTVGGSASPTQLRITVEPSRGVVAPDRGPVATGTLA